MHNLGYSLGRSDHPSLYAVFLDTEADSLDDSPIWCVSVRPEPYGTVFRDWFDRDRSESTHVDPAHATIMGLAVQRVGDGSSNTFCRVRLVRWLKKLLFVDVKDSDFVLV